MSGCVHMQLTWRACGPVCGTGLCPAHTQQWLHCARRSAARRTMHGSCIPHTIFTVLTPCEYEERAEAARSGHAAAASHPALSARAHKRHSEHTERLHMDLLCAISPVRGWLYAVRVAAWVQIMPYWLKADVKQRRISASSNKHRHILQGRAALASEKNAQKRRHRHPVVHCRLFCALYGTKRRS